MATMFARRHYEAIADILGEHIRVANNVGDFATVSACEEIADDMASLFARDNDRFNRDRFYKACNRN